MTEPTLDPWDVPHIGHISVFAETVISGWPFRPEPGAPREYPRAPTGRWVARAHHQARLGSPQRLVGRDCQHEFFASTAESAIEQVVESLGAEHPRGVLVLNISRH